MNFNDPKVKQAIFEHLQFAINSVNSAMPVVETSQSAWTDDKMLAELGQTFRVALIVQILQFTLNKDYRLANSITGAKLPENMKPEDSLLQ